MMTRLKAFAKAEHGNIALETAIIIPVLFWAYLMLYATFDAYRHHAINQKAAYTIGDIISRESNPIDSDYLDGMHQLLGYLTHTPANDVSIRLTSIQYDEENDEYIRDWSEKMGSKPVLSDADVGALANRLPIMPDDEYVMLVETFVPYDPPFDTGLQTREIVNFVFTRWRYVPKVAFD